MPMLLASPLVRPSKSVRTAIKRPRCRSRPCKLSQLGEDNTISGNPTLQDLASGQYLVNGRAQDAIEVIDAAIDEVTNVRGELGAFQSNTLQTNVNSLRVTMENLTAAESTIRDVDFAAESAEFTRSNILIQASTSMLAQANQLPQNVLQLGLG